MHRIDSRKPALLACEPRPTPPAEGGRAPTTGPSPWRLLRAAGAAWLLFANRAAGAVTPSTSGVGPSATALRSGSGPSSTPLSVAQIAPRKLLEVRGGREQPLPGAGVFRELRDRARAAVARELEREAHEASEAHATGEAHAAGEAPSADAVASPRVLLEPKERASPPPPPPRRPRPKAVHFSDFTPAQLEDFNRHIRDYVTPELLERHERWHMENGPGGTTGPGSGKKFLDFHAKMLAAGEAYFRSRGWARDFVFPEYGANTNIPKQLRDPARPGEPKRVTTRPRVTIPPWLTVDGKGDAKTWGQRDPIFGRRTLREFKSLDELGRAIGEIYHAEGHAAIGGVMSSFASPRDPTFWGWHKHLAHIVATYQWLKSST